MPIDPSSDITFEELIASYSHTKPGSSISRCLRKRLATSLVDKRHNQTIKYLQLAAPFHCAQSVLNSGPRGEFAECGCFRGQVVREPVLAVASSRRGAQFSAGGKLARRKRTFIRHPPPISFNFVSVMKPLQRLSDDGAD